MPCSSSRLLFTLGSLALLLPHAMAASANASLFRQAHDRIIRELYIHTHSSSLLPRHEHDDSEPPDPSVPIDSILYAHIVIQLLTWGVMYPAGMVLGLAKSRWHVPMQSAATILTFVGFRLAHHHGGRRFYHTTHDTFASFCFWYMLSQVALGIFCKLHIMEDTVRPKVARVHSWFGKAFPFISWAQIVMGFITAHGFCFDEPGDHLGQCLAHFIMGSSFQLYGIVLLLMLRYGSGWLARHKCSQDYLDSWMITSWGIVNTFTEHDFLHQRGVWSHKDMQHTTLGVIWWAGGALGIWLGRNGKRTFMPAIVIAITGLAMGAHGQANMMATKIHQIFGATLFAAGAIRIIEISFLANKEPIEDGKVLPFFHLHPLLLTIGGMIFLSATEEQLAWMIDIDMDHVTYALLICSAAFVLYLFINMLMSLYDNSGLNAPERPGQDTPLPLFSWKGLRSTAARPTDQGYANVQATAPGRLDTGSGRTSQEDYELDDRYWQEETVEVR